ncbi:protein transport protein bos1 [Mortierella antarctica]|nr:protein transport protein bos1 [Mortierella antarctica]
MNSLYNHALKQVNTLQRDLDKFQSGEDTSVALQGSISAIVNAFKRSIDDYETMAKKEMIDAKREKAFA